MFRPLFPLDQTIPVDFPHSAKLVINIIRTIAPFYQKTFKFSYSFLKSIFRVTNYKYWCSSVGLEYTSVWNVPLTLVIHTSRKAIPCKPISHVNLKLLDWLWIKQKEICLRMIWSHLLNWFWKIIFLSLMRMFRQKLGAVIGTKFACCFANIFIGYFEERFLDSCELKPWVWWRFWDDVFMIWLYGEDELKDFLAKLNSFHESIKFTWEIGLQEIAFLDVWITKVNGTFHTDVYSKPTDEHQYL